MKLELFHAIAEPGSSKVRKWAEAQGLLPTLRLRNVVYPEVLADLKAHGGDEGSVPALWDGAQLVVGADAVVARLSQRPKA